ncbi:unnamed protein product [Coffea canephora]|uniref:Protein kinase domain-containing protein n=1 Tax=Coffea canephora TaxID=49390 RepID=A0A068V7A5_COFCA|nr:unnamed protein product [Coffea canephora]
MWAFWTSTLAYIFLLLQFVMSFPAIHVSLSAAKQFQNETDRLALLEFKHQIYDDPFGVLNSWNHSQYHCQWEGVTCSTRHQRVVALTLMDRHIWNYISSQFDRLFRLRVLNLSSNALGGKIPANLSYCSQMITIILNRNKLEGKIPIVQLSKLKKLENFHLDTNNLTGEIPSSIGNLSSLTTLALDFNNLEGNLPSEMGLLKNFAILAAGGNKLSGIIPASIFNCSAIIAISVPTNSFHGNLPTNIGLTLPNLEGLYPGANKFYGNFPTSITNASGLEVLDLSRNKFEGQIPANLRDLTNLIVFDLYDNLFGSKSTGDLDFVASLINCSNLRSLSLSGNEFGGNIPKKTLFLGKLKNLRRLRLDHNEFSGQIVSTLSNSTTLYHLDLSTNHFEGGNVFDNVLVNYQNLQYLDISQNNFTGIISPHFLQTQSSLMYMILGENSFSGSLPPEIGKLIHLVDFNVSHNHLVGDIPLSLADCSNLENLSMQANFFQGTIPPNLTSLKSIQKLDLASNKLTGPIPKELEKLQFLRYLNLSSYDIEGEIRNTGVFSNASQISLIGNNKLLAAWVSIMSTRVDKHLQISYHELHRVTSGFSPENLIGSGNFGTVYKGRLEKHGNKLVAVKVLDLQKNGASKSFKAECKTLRNIRHRNVISIMSYCSSIDSKGDEFKALVYEFIENGNLDLWLHPSETTDQATSSRSLNLLQMLNIAIDVASALQYLHNHCEAEIVHCVVKPSNILLDNDLVAHVGDFGLARLLPKPINISSEQGTSSTIAIKGTIGYTAPGKYKFLRSLKLYTNY